MPENASSDYRLPAICRLRGPQELSVLEIHPGLGAFSTYNPRRAEIVRESLGKTLRIPCGEVFAAIDDSTLVGYLLLVPSGPDQPWGRLNDRRILEIGVEVARGHRGRGLATALFRAAFSQPEVEGRIYVATAYEWCWDVEGSRVSVSEYADRLLRLFEAAGFQRDWTNEPNIMMQPANFLAVRIGREVPPALLRRFRQSQRGELAA